MTSDQAHESHCRREYAGAKISKVKFLLDEYDNAEYFVTGSWGKTKHAASDSVTLWSTKNEPTEESSGIEKLSCQKVESDVNDISVVSQSRFVVGLSNGDIKVFGCSGEALESKQTYSTVHAKASSTAVCVVSNTIFSGSDTGSIVRIPMDSSNSSQTSIVTTDLMEVTSLVSYGASQLVSAHTTGQVHLWDIRQPAKPSLEFSILSRIPVVSKAVAALNDSVTAIASHPSEPNVIAFGTNSGHISFFDIRAPSQDLPNLLKVCPDSVNCVNFNPVYPNNFFSSSDTGLIHWDASSLNYQPMRDSNDDDKIHGNIWLSGKVWTNIGLNALVEDDPKLLSCFDVSESALVVGSNTCELIFLKNLDFH